MGAGSVEDMLKNCKATMRCDKETGKDVIVWMTPEFPPLSVATATLDCLQGEDDGNLELRVHRPGNSDIVFVGEEARTIMTHAIDVEDLEFQIHEKVEASQPTAPEQGAGYADDCAMQSA
ncbi:hypothetical protein IT409_02140 [Candidatus Falkowbacteria bacterium]|nr:hypothetical protein [Candidatus Falkowbacteria bacterium]